ncbi:MAG: ABC transporter permease subunit [Lachnospiraceae bacterium]|nr:ABC transporter permease subunit [Lachnospiraceae bacterium]
MEEVRNVFRRRKITNTCFFAGMILIFAAASMVTGFHVADGIRSFPAAAEWIVSNLVPDARALGHLPKILDRLTETALLSAAVTVLAAVFAFLFSLLGSDILKIHWAMKRMVRIAAAFFRNVPDVAWAMLLMFSFGQNILTGFFALFFTTFGLLTRAFVETIDEVSSSCVEALEATGAGIFPIVFQGILPSSLPGVLTWVLYMIETNIRSSTLIGILTATGIGYLFDLYYKRLDFSSASLVVLSIVILVLLIEAVSNKIREVIM